MVNVSDNAKISNVFGHLFFELNESLKLIPILTGRVNGRLAITRILCEERFVKIGDQLELTLTDLSRGGAAVARAESGQVVFVPYGAPGDRVLVSVSGIEKRYIQAEIIKILVPSSQRIAPRCSVFGKCGGCEWQHLPDAIQWQAKLQGVRHALERVGVATPKDFEEFPATETWGYRNRVQLRGFQEEIGFFAPRSHRLVPIESCPVANNAINRQIPSVREEGKKLKRPYKVEISGASTGAEVTRTWNAPHAASGFRQVHDAQNEKLRSWILHQLTPGQLLYDLFGGNGNLSLPAASKMTEVHCVDLSCSKELTKGVQPPHFHFHNASVLSWLLRRATTFKEFCPASAIFDPPRQGLAENFDFIADSIEKMHVNEVFAVGCDPDAWGRDVFRWIKRGWVFQKAAVFDFFPQTHHVEAVALLHLTSL